MSETPPPPTEELRESASSSRPLEAPRSAPRPLSSIGGGDPAGAGGADRIARIQTLAAVVLGLALIAIPLYLWRRPRSESIPVTSALDASAPLGDAGLVTAASGSAAIAPPPQVPQVTLSDPKVMECHDVGPRRTRPEDCDHLAPVEKGFAAAISAGGPCLPSTSGGGTLVYILDASFGRKRHPFELFIPRDGRSLKNAHGVAAAATACSAAVRKGLEGVSLEGVTHAHARYKIAITATYAPANASPP